MGMFPCAPVFFGLGRFLYNRLSGVLIKRARLPERV